MLTEPRPKDRPVFPLPAYVIGGCHSTLAAQHKFSVHELKPEEMMRDASVYRLSVIGTGGCKCLGRMDNLKAESAAKWRSDFLDQV
jgi:hypothetical protein